MCKLLFFVALVLSAVSPLAATAQTLSVESVKTDRHFLYTLHFQGPDAKEVDSVQAFWSNSDRHPVQGVVEDFNLPARKSNEPGTFVLEGNVPADAADGKYTCTLQVYIEAVRFSYDLGVPPLDVRGAHALEKPELTVDRGR